MLGHTFENLVDLFGAAFRRDVNLHINVELGRERMHPFREEQRPAFQHYSRRETGEL